MPLPPPTNPGISIEELPSAPQPIEGVATSRAAFLGAAARGPINRAVHLQSFTDYQREFGSLVTTLELGYAVAQFFANGGTNAWVVRIARRPQLRQVSKGLAALESVETINLLALPGLTRPEFVTAAIEFARSRRAFFIADPPAEATTPAKMFALADNGLFPAEPNAAVFYPWLEIADSANGNLPRRTAPSGAVAGVFARTDAELGVWKAPSGIGAQLRGVTALAPTLTDADSDLLKARAINSLRTFSQLGAVVWGARTLAGADESSDWNRINVRRLALFIEESIDRGTRWAVLEENAEPLWMQLRAQIGTFLNGPWREGALQGAKAEESFFVRCDRTTMTQADLDSGRLVIEIGIAPVRPAEFVIIRIGQWTRHDPPP